MPASDINIFDQPKRYISNILERVNIPPDKRKEFKGKSLASIFLTKFCEAECPHCFFRSGKEQINYPQEQCEISDYGIERFIEFINKSNNGYLLVIGGGEPFKKVNQIVKIIRRVKTDRIILVTNGMWANSYDNAKKIIFSLYEAYKQRHDDTKVILRLSLDKWHSKQLGNDLIYNTVEIFKEFFKEEINFELQIHTLIDDPTIDEVFAKYDDCKITRTSETGISDNEEIVKISPYRCKIEFKSGYVIYVGIARTFYSNLKPDLTSKSEIIEKAVDIYDKDMAFSAFDNPSVIINKGNTYGLNFWVNYNGNVALWGNQQIYNLSNIYVDSYEDVINASFENIIAYTFLDKGYKHRQGIVNEVNPKAVLRSTAINIRDYAGAAILEEAKTVLYYAVRSTQEYLIEGKIKKENLFGLPNELIQVITLDKEEIKKLYNKSNYSIISELMEKPFNKDEWRDLFTLINLGHYDISDKQKKEALEIYNTNTEEKLNSIKEVMEVSRVHYDRLNERITFMKPEAKLFCQKLHLSETNSLDKPISQNSSLKLYAKEAYRNDIAVFLILTRVDENGKREILLQKRKNTGYMDGMYDLAAARACKRK